MSDKLAKALFVGAAAIVTAISSGYLGKLTSDRREAKRKKQLNAEFAAIDKKIAQLKLLKKEK
ncbi:MAG: hypothetical protein KKF24_05475 [Gammaproteobacteria bacterium]|nr:hypothetical protein [Gammaproteobacteria bacterium]